MPTYTDTELLKNRQAGQAETYGMTNPATATAGPAAEIGKLHTYFVSFAKAADDGAASTTTAETRTGKSNSSFKVRVKSVKINATTGGVATDNTNNVTVTVSKRDATGANPLPIATYTSNVAGGAITQDVLKAMVLTPANVDVDANSTFTYTIAKGGTGVVMRACEFILELEKI